MKENYERWMNREIQRFQARGEVPRLLLHSCCAPCSSAVLESVFRYFEITVFYYNPNIFPKEEYLHRVQEQKRFLAQFPPASSVTFLEGDYQPERFFQLAQGLEQEPEGGERCARCYELRLREAARLAAEGGYDFFTTTLTISPLKNAEKLNQIGAELADTFGVRYLFSDFKKKEGYKKSTEISKEYHMYRQYYCGCVYSKRDRDREIVLRRQQEEQIL